MKKILEIKNLCACADNKQILKGLDLNINAGEIHVVMGPNGAGKSTLANAILGNPLYTKTDGKIIFDGQDITNWQTDKIARSGVFMSFQTPEEIPGISVFNFIKTAKSKNSNNTVDYFELQDEIQANMKELNMPADMQSRDFNVGFSGGEKKKNEILQMLELSPKLAILDETDSGLDVDAIAIARKGIKMFANKDNALLIITHSTKIIEDIDVDFVHIISNGKIVLTGKKQLAYEIEKKGYKDFII